MWKLPSRSGSLIRPFQPTVVRGFSKYTRMTISSCAGVAARARPLGAGRIPARPSGRGWSRGRSPPAAGRPRRAGSSARRCARRPRWRWPRHRAGTRPAARLAWSARASCGCAGRRYSRSRSAPRCKKKPPGSLAVSWVPLLLPSGYAQSFRHIGWNQVIPVKVAALHEYRFTRGTAAGASALSIIVIRPLKPAVRGPFAPLGYTGHAGQSAIRPSTTKGNHEDP